MGEDNKNLKELHIIDGATGEEIPVTPIKEIEFCEKEDEFEENLDEWFKASRGALIELEIQSIENIQEMQKLFAKADKVYLKSLSPLTKKTCKKIINVTRLWPKFSKFNYFKNEKQKLKKSLGIFLFIVDKNVTLWYYTFGGGING